MGLRVSGAGAVASMLSNLSQKTNKSALREMRKGAKLIEDQAIANAPVDEGNLEDSIISEEDRGGVNRRVRIVVGVDESKEVASIPGKVIGNYAEIMHESHYELGSKSQAKQNSDPGTVVGRKYLERAIDEHEKDIADAVQKAIKGSL